MNNQEKLYIDIDEEITTIIDRLRRISAQLVYVVVPQRALLLQSIVNLKLLERESRKQGKKIVIMTKDESGIVFASRAGIEVQPFIGSEEAFENQISPNENYFSNNTHQIRRNQNNLNSQKSNNFYSAKDYNLNQESNYSSFSPKPVQVKNPVSNNFSANYYQNSPVNSPKYSDEENRYFSEKANKPTMDMQVKKRNVVLNERKNFNYSPESNSNPQFTNRNYATPPQEQKQNFVPSNFSNPNFSNENENQRDSYLEYLSSENLKQQDNLQNSTSDFYSKNSGGHQMVDENFYQFEQNNNFPKEEVNHSPQNFSAPQKSNSQNSFYNNQLNSKSNLPLSKVQAQNDYFSKDRNRDFAESSNAEVSYLSRKKPREMAKNSPINPSFNSAGSQRNLPKTTIDKKNHIKSESNFFSKLLVISFFLTILGVGFYFIFPKTDLIVKIKEVNIDENINFTAKVDQTKTDLEKMIIPARQIKKEVVYSRNFESTGKADLDSQKAQGMVTIHNEFEDKEITLVKTTRFISENGILFRLAENVNVPKAKMEGSKKVNGTVKALLVADQAGEKGNVKSPTFFVVTYKETDPERYKKVYAKSDSEMKGGGVGGKGMLVVTEDDIKKAKENMENSLEAFAREEITGLIRSDEVLIFKNKDSSEIKVTASNSKVAVGTATKEFSYEITADVTAMVFSQKNVGELAMEAIKKKNKEVDQNKIDLKYNSAKAEFDSGNLKVEAKATVKYKPDFDVMQFKKDILGKNYTEVESLIKEKYKQIEGNIEPTAFPSFFSGRISRFEKMTKVMIE